MLKSLPKCSMCLSSLLLFQFSSPKCGRVIRAPFWAALLFKPVSKLPLCVCSPELCYCLRNILPFSNYFLKHLRMPEFFYLTEMPHFLKWELFVRLLACSCVRVEEEQRYSFPMQLWLGTSTSGPVSACGGVLGWRTEALPRILAEVTLDSIWPNN